MIPPKIYSSKAQQILRYGFDSGSMNFAKGIFDFATIQSSDIG
jgi:hypothetical protein